MEVTAQEIATCCRLGGMLMGDGRMGPGLAQVNMETMFVRDADFFYELAQEMAGKMGDVYSQYHELRRANEESNAENAAKRKARSEAIEIASDVVDVCRHLMRHHRERWQSFEKMIRKQTLRQIVRRDKKRGAALIASDIEWCSTYILDRIGAERLEKLLTLRAIMA